MQVKSSGVAYMVLLQVGEDLRMPVEQGQPLIPSQVGTHDWRQPFQGWKEQRQDMTTSFRAPWVPVP